jgi:hypothetical protein
MDTTNMHALSGIRNHDPSVRASEDSSCFRPRGYCDRPSTLHRYTNYQLYLLYYGAYISVLNDGTFCEKL